MLSFLLSLLGPQRLQLTCHFHLILGALWHLPITRKKGKRDGRSWPAAPSDKLPGGPRSHLRADLASLFGPKLSSRKRGPTGSLRTPASACTPAQTLPRAARRDRQGPSRAPRWPDVRSGASSFSRTPGAPPQKSPCGKEFTERRLLCTRSRPTACRRRLFPRAAPETPHQSREPPGLPHSGPARFGDCRPGGPGGNP